jgi:hypothetical protein
MIQIIMILAFIFYLAIVGLGFFLIMELFITKFKDWKHLRECKKITKMKLVT